MAKGERHVTCARGHVYDEYVKPGTALVRPVAPVDVEEELLNGLLDHQAAPDHGGVCAGVRARWTGEEETHGHTGNAVVHERDNCAA